MPIRYDRRHTDTLTWWLRRHQGQGATSTEMLGILEERDVAQDDFILEEMDAGALTDLILQEGS